MPLAALCGTAFSLVALAQDPVPAAQDPAATGGLVRQSSGFDTSRWETRLTEPNLADRLVHYEALVDLARVDPVVRAALEAWTQGADPELAWTATLALRESRRPGSSGSPRVRSGLGRRAPVSGFGSGAPSDELDSMEQRLDEMLRSMGATGGIRGLHGLRVPPGSSSQSKSYQLEQGPNGVKITLRELVDGDEQLTTYEGESMEQLLEQHPELREAVGGGALDPLTGGAFEQFFRGGQSRQRGLAPRGNRGQGLQRVPAPSAPAPPHAPGTLGQLRTDRLGVYVESSGAAGAPAATDAKPGLPVREVVPGGLADVMRVRAGDVLIELDGTPLYSAADIASALASRGATDEVRLRIVDNQGSSRTLSWSPPK